MSFEVCRSIDYTLEPMQQRNFNFSYMFQYNDINIYEEGERAYNTTYKYHLAEFGFSDVWYKNFRFGLGFRFEYYKYKDFLFKKPELTGLECRVRILRRQWHFARDRRCLFQSEHGHRWMG